MILGQVSWLDCAAFLIFLAPQLLIHVGLFATLRYALSALPFLIIRLPVSFVYERYLLRVLRPEDRSPFVRQSSTFEDVAIRCVRYAFAKIPAKIGRVFFSKWVALPFLRFRMIRHGYYHSPINWHEVALTQNNLKGLWISYDESLSPDIVIYFVHGGGFLMGSSYFYLEFLLAWLSLLKSSGFRNPAIFALEYTLVGSTAGDACYPTQLQQAISGYKYVLSITRDPSKICVSGDSAGATLILSLLLHLGSQNDEHYKADYNGMKMAVPEMAVLISPWVTLVSTQYRNTTSDYLDVEILRCYARQYAGPMVAIDDPSISPGNCKHAVWWRNAGPSKGFFISYGSDEVFAPEIRDLVDLLVKVDVSVEAYQEEGGIHAWPVAALFLSSSRERRQKGLKKIVDKICERMRR